MHGSFETESMRLSVSRNRTETRKIDNSKPKSSDFTPLRRLKEEVRERVYSF